LKSRKNKKRSMLNHWLPGWAVGGKLTIRGGAEETQIKPTVGGKAQRPKKIKTVWR